MQLPITDKFLWKIYELIESVDEAYDFWSPRTMSHAIHPESYKLKREYEKWRAKTGFSQFIQNLQNRGYIKTKALQGTKEVILTPKGAKRAFRIKIKTLKKKRRKDGKWIMVIFDIPEKKKHIREMLRDALVNLGYQKFQKSVWICPYNVQKETEEATRAHQAVPYVKLFIIEEVI